MMTELGLHRKYQGRADTYSQFRVREFPGVVKFHTRSPTLKHAIKEALKKASR
jgi:hypothetical protein